jgi:probable HAF family extracellular repeat protein
MKAIVQVATKGCVMTRFPLSRSFSQCRLLMFALFAFSACTDPVTPSAPLTSGSASAARTGGGPTVKSTSPDTATVDSTLNVHVFGSGFDAGSRAQWALKGVPSSKVVTNSTRFVSSTELVANIAIAPDATLASYDVIVTTSSGKGGIGTELFVVTAKATDLGTLGGTQSEALGINNSAQVVGWSYVPSGVEHAFLWTRASGMQDLGTLGGTASHAYAINDNGQVVGSSTTAAGDKHAFLWTATDGMRDIGTLGGVLSEALAISKNGAIVGGSFLSGGGSEVTFLWSAGVMENIGGTRARGLAVNNALQVVGTADVGVVSSTYRSLLWTKSGGVWTSEELDGPNPNGGSYTYGINELGQIMGDFITTTSQRGAYTWTRAGGYKVLPVLPKGTGVWANAINDAGRIVGYGNDVSGFQHPAVWDPKGDGWTITTFAGAGTSKGASWVNALNDNHQAAGGSRMPGGSLHATLWEVP